MSITAVSVGLSNQALVRAVFRDGNNNVVRIPPSQVVWTTSNSSVAIVSSPWDYVRSNFDKAFIYGVSIGSATVTATCPGFAPINITVTVFNPAATTMEIDLQPAQPTAPGWNQTGTGGNMFGQSNN